MEAMDSGEGTSHNVEVCTYKLCVCQWIHHNTVVMYTRVSNQY